MTWCKMNFNIFFGVFDFARLQIGFKMSYQSQHDSTISLSVEDVLRSIRRKELKPICTNFKHNITQRIEKMRSRGWTILPHDPYDHFGQKYYLTRELISLSRWHISCHT